MRIILFLFLICFSIAPAYAYKEDNRAGEAQATAGEQNTNLYRLNSKGKIALKKLKQASEYVERSKAAGKTVKASAIEDLLLSGKAEDEKMEINRLTEAAAKQLEKPLQLKVAENHAVYETIAQMQASQIKDKQIAKTLAQQLGRTKK